MEVVKYSKKDYVEIVEPKLLKIKNQIENIKGELIGLNYPSMYCISEIIENINYAIKRYNLFYNSIIDFQSKIENTLNNFESSLLSVKLEQIKKEN